MIVTDEEQDKIPQAKNTVVLFMENEPHEHVK